MSVKIVLDNTIAQLTAQKTKAYNEAHSLMQAQLSADLDEFKKEKQAEYDETVAQLKQRFDAVVAAKQAVIDEQARAYAEKAVEKVEEAIATVQKLLTEE